MNVEQTVCIALQDLSSLGFDLNLPHMKDAQLQVNYKAIEVCRSN